MTLRIISTFENQGFVLDQILGIVLDVAPLGIHILDVILTTFVFLDSDQEINRIELRGLPFEGLFPRLFAWLSRYTHTVRIHPSQCRGKDETVRIVRIHTRCDIGENGIARFEDLVTFGGNIEILLLDFEST